MRLQRTYAAGASAMGVPGCPESAFWTASIESVRTVSMQSRSRSSAGAGEFFLDTELTGPPLIGLM
jgi:hypothetical protein